MKKCLSLLVFGLLLGFSAVCSAAELGGGYSIEVVGEWEVKEFPGSKFKGVFGTGNINFAANINITEENYGGPMNTYISLVFVQVEKLMRAKNIGQGPFSAKNTTGVKLKLDTQFNDVMLRQIIYFFENSDGQKVVVAASATRKSGDLLEQDFDRMLHTFVVR